VAEIARDDEVNFNQVIDWRGRCHGELSSVKYGFASLVHAMNRKDILCKIDS
jgi:hypothetical protein